MKNFINKVKTNKEARKHLLACCGWGAVASVFIAVCNILGNLIGYKLGESIGEFIES